MLKKDCEINELFLNYIEIFTWSNILYNKTKNSLPSKNVTNKKDFSSKISAIQQEIY